RAFAAPYGAPVRAASCRRSRSHLTASRVYVSFHAVQGRTELAPLANAPLAVPSIAAAAGNSPKGRAQEARACAAVQGRTVCAARPRREAQESPIRTMRIGPPRSALDLFGYFLGQCQKVARSAEG